MKRQNSRREHGDNRVRSPRVSRGGTNRKQFKMLLIFLFLSFFKIFVAFPFSHFFCFSPFLGKN